MAMSALTLTFSTYAHTASLDNQALRDGELQKAWAQGSVIVLLRHAERCDRSTAPCLDALDGITVAGSQAATEVGHGLQHLGLSNADILSSPLVRTAQTAHFMFGESIPSQDWLSECRGNFPNNAFSHKHTGRNLVLVTHSGCIEGLEQQLGVPANERSSPYASALFVDVSTPGNPRILGQINANQWRNRISKAG